MGIENKVHDLLMGVPALKKVAKRIYQGASVVVARPKKSEGNIVRVTPDDQYEYLFGYYDKSPWDASGRYMLCLRVKNASREVAPKSIAEIVLIDTEKNNSIKVIAKTHTWNVQQGCMAGWLGPNFDKEIFYNDYRHGKYCGIVLNIETGKEKILDMPVYTVSNDGKIALSLDFSRLHRLRPGYGYSNIKDRTIGQKIPDGPCVWKINIKTGKSEPILSYEALYNFEHRKDMENADHKVNHLMLSPDGKRFMVIHRWLKGGKKKSRLLTCDNDGKNLYNLSDEDMVSHCCWKNNRVILAYCKHDGENGYYLFKDQTKDCSRKWDFITADGHPSYSPNSKLVVTDTYPNRKRVCTLRVLSDTVSTVVAKVYAPFKYDNDTRCDLHPRWSRDGKKICFDGCFEGKRGLYIITIEEKKPKLSVIVPVYNCEQYIRRCVESILQQEYNNLELILVNDGSTDGSLDICKSFAKKDARVKILSKKNSGQGAARNLGVKESTGDYITFVDGDDWIAEDIYAFCMKKLLNLNADIIDYECRKVSNTQKLESHQTRNNRCRIMKGDRALQYFMRRGLRSENCPYSICRKIMSKQLLQESPFPENISNEDILVAFRVTKKAKKVIYTERVGYYYYQSPKSTTRGKLSAYDLGIFDICEKMLEESKGATKRIIRHAQIKLYRCDFSILSRIAMYGVDESLNEKKLVEELLPRLKSNSVKLVFSPLPTTRKVLVFAYCINYGKTCKVLRSLKKQ